MYAFRLGYSFYSGSVEEDVNKKLLSDINSIEFREVKIVYNLSAIGLKNNFGLSECNRVKGVQTDQCICY